MAEINNDSNSGSVLSVYYAPSTVLSMWHIITHSILIITTCKVENIIIPIL